jgi:hypothetical protein
MDNNYSFRHLFILYTFFIIPFAILGGILSLFDFDIIWFNDRPYHGTIGFIISILYIPFFGLVFSCSNWLALNGGRTFYGAFLKLKKRK